MGRVKEFLMDLEIVCMLDLCSYEDLQNLSFEEQCNLILKAEK